MSWTQEFRFNIGDSAYIAYSLNGGEITSADMIEATVWFIEFNTQNVVLEDESVITQTNINYGVTWDNGNYSLILPDADLYETRDDLELALFPDIPPVITSAIQDGTNMMLKVELFTGKYDTYSAQCSSSPSFGTNVTYSSISKHDITDYAFDMSEFGTGNYYFRVYPDDNAELNGVIGPIAYTSGVMEIL